MSSNNNAFGRRPSREDQPAVRRRGKVQAEAVPDEEPQFDMGKALAWGLGAVATLVVGGIAVLLLAPSGQTPVAAPASTARIAGASPAEIAPQLGALAGAFERGEPQPQAAPAASVPRSGAVSDEVHTAALKFFGFYHLNTRVRSAYCAKLGVDMTGFSQKFGQANASLHRRATEVAVAAGSSEERIFETSRAELDGLIGADLAKIGSQVGTGPDGACRLMVQMADAIVPGIAFAKVMPDAHRALTGT